MAPDGLQASCTQPTFLHPAAPSPADPQQTQI